MNPSLFSSAQAFKNHPDIEKAACVILDINLPDGSGIELREDLKAAGISVPVIYITGNANPKVRDAALASGCVGISHQAVLSARADRAAQESIGRVELSARVPGHCTLYFGTMHHRTTFPDLISEFGLSGTDPPYRYTAPRGPSFPRTGATPFHGLGARSCCFTRASVVDLGQRPRSLGTHAMFSRTGGGSITFHSQARRGVRHASDEAYFDQVSDCCRDCC